MILSEKILKIMKNFSEINSSILLREGNLLSTISPSKTIVGKSAVDVDFPRTCGIYDISTFLSALSLFKNPEIEFEESYCTIKQGNNKIRYMYANPKVILVPPDTIKMPKSIIDFTMSSEMYLECIKAMSILNTPYMVITGENNKLSLESYDIENPTSDRYTVEIGDCNKEFSAVFEAENLKIIPGNYQVSIANGISYFKSDIVEYYIAVHKESVFNDA